MSKNEKKKDERLYNKNFLQACSNAVNGIVYSATTQTNIRKQLIIGFIVMMLSLFYNFTTSEFLIVTMSIFFVIFAELVNTAIETVVDLLVDVYHPKAKIAKDVAAGAVVLAAINSIVVLYFLFFREARLTDMSNSLLKYISSTNAHITFVGLIITVIVIIAVKSYTEGKKFKTCNPNSVVPSGQSAIAFAILSSIWFNTKNLFVFALALTLSILVIGNRMNDKRSFAEVIFGACMGILVIVGIYGLTIFRM